MDFKSRGKGRLDGQSGLLSSVIRSLCRLMKCYGDGSTTPSSRSFFISLLAEAPFAAFRWENPPMTSRDSAPPGGVRFTRQSGNRQKS